MNIKIVSTLFCVFALMILNTPEIYSQDNPCNSCAGRGVQQCIRCGGGGQFTCGQCDGAGGKWEICNCNNGIVTMPDGSTQTCNYCGGEGRKWHSCFNPICNGGTVNCNFCGGQGQLTCPACNGTGRQ